MEYENKSRIPVEENTQMRDAVINRLYDLSKNDKDIMFFTADMGAVALDRWRKNRKDQYRDVGIAEQAMASVAAGMAREGKKPFIYAIAPFVVTRIHEFHKLNAGVQNLPYNVIGVGTGFSYSDSGPTHYNTEDISLMRVVPNMEILSPSDSMMAANFAENIVNNSRGPSYLRLERSVLPIITDPSESLHEGFRELVSGENTCLISTGNMVHNALKAQKELEDENINVGVVDLYRLKPLNVSGLIETFGKYNNLVSIEEHNLAGGMGSSLSEVVTDHDLDLRLKRIGIDDRLVYLYGRENIQRELGLDVDTIKEKVKKLM